MSFKMFLQHICNCLRQRLICTPGDSLQVDRELLGQCNADAWFGGGHRVAVNNISVAKVQHLVHAQTFLFLRFLTQS